MHASERDQLILDLLREQDFLSLQMLCELLEASPATVRRDLERLEQQGMLQRVHGGARPSTNGVASHLQGAPFDLNLRHQLNQKMAIGRVASTLCGPGDAVIIDGGTTTFQMCPYLQAPNLQVLTNSLHIVNALLRQPNVKLSVPGGSVFAEQNIILSPFDDDGLNHFHATKMFVGAAAINERGLLQADSILVQAERKLMARADVLVALVDSSKFRSHASLQLCALEQVDLVITDDGISKAERAMLRKAGIEVTIAR
jgi:DeoR family ulaG and ulaABCDEF operon transcriptional repressor